MNLMRDAHPGNRNATWLLQADDATAEKCHFAAYHCALGIEPSGEAATWPVEPVARCPILRLSWSFPPVSSTPLYRRMWLGQRPAQCESTHSCTTAHSCLSTGM